MGIWEKTGAGNDQDPSNKILKILHMESISIENPEMEICNMDKISFENIEDPSTP